MKHKIYAMCLCLAATTAASARDYHVRPDGNDAANGSVTTPLRTINRAAQLALPGDTVTVHNGVYREWINPLNGGESDRKRILYRVADGEEAEVKGSEIVTGWKQDKKNKSVWKLVLPNKFFDDYNPFNDRLYGDWLWSSKIHHTADVFLNDVSLYEAYSLDKVFAPDTMVTIRDPKGSSLVWFAEVDSLNTTIHANFGTTNPNKECTEVSVRPTCFYPTREGLNYITIRGFKFNQAATQWAAPTAEQVGMVSTHWCKGWIIENNIIKNSRANGITLGKERATGHNLDCHDKRLDGTLHYIEVVFNTLRRGWDKANVGSHIVRNNIISDCEQTGICGSMGGAFSEIYNNHIYNILCKQQFNGAEMAGIKLHGALDTHIHDNIIHNSGNYGIWLDWMAQGAHVSSNI
ncbi:MAG: right-handed parallel beta-helix repeat-containing protein, partial [Bacteroidaceae bacterium]